MRAVATKHATRRTRGMTLTELAAASAVTAVVLLIAYATLEMGRRGTADVLGLVDTSRNVFNTLRTIEYDIMRAEQIEVPDPDYPEYDSIQVRVPTGAGVVRRAFRQEGDALIMDYKDELDAPYAAFDGVSSLTFTPLDAPTNSIIEIDCVTAGEGHTIHMQTVARKRN